MAATKKATERANTLWGGLGTGQRLGLLGAGALVAVGLWLWFSSASYAVLFGNLAPEDAAEVVETLETHDVSYRLVDGGSTIQVRADRVYELRLRLASQSIPQSGEVGYAIFSETLFGGSDAQERSNNLRALEAELTRTIRDIDEVEGARIHLALPDTTIVEGEEHSAAATVVLQLHAGSTLGSTQARGVAYLVAASVPGLTPADVTIADVNGTILDLGGGESGAALAASHFEHKSNFERRTERRILAAIERVLGVGLAVVHVSARFNFDQVEQTAEVFDPEGVVVKSTSSGNGRKEVSYEVPRTVTRTVKPPGRLEQLKVDVMVDGAYSDSTTGGEKAFTPRSDEELARIGELATKVAELDLQRGDRLEVQSISFRPDESITLADPGMGAGFYLVLVKYGMGLVAVLFLFPLVFRPFMRLLSGEGSATGSALARGEVDTPVTLAHLERELGLDVAPGADPALQVSGASLDEARKRDTLKKELIEHIEEEPEAAASLIRNWVAE